MSEYRIEKLKREVSVLLANGERLEGQMFLRPVSRYRPRSEDPLELLNDVEPFFPLMLENGKAVLISKSGVAIVETSIEDEDQDLTALGYLVDVTLINGSSCRGSVFVERQPGRQRLYDFLNAYPSRFMSVVNTDKLILINTQTIAQVREVD
jgi:hypothetical protein